MGSPQQLSQRGGQRCTPRPSPCTPKRGSRSGYLCPVAAEICSSWGARRLLLGPQPWLSQRLRSRRDDATARGTAMPRRPGNCPQVVMHLLRKRSRAVSELPANHTPRPAVRGGPGQRLRPQQAGRHCWGPARRRGGCSGGCRAGPRARVLSAGSRGERAPTLRLPT